MLVDLNKKEYAKISTLMSNPSDDQFDSLPVDVQYNTHTFKCVFWCSQRRLLELSDHPPRRYTSRKKKITQSTWKMYATAKPSILLLLYLFVVVKRQVIRHGSRSLSWRFHQPPSQHIEAQQSSQHSTHKTIMQCYTTPQEIRKITF